MTQTLKIEDIAGINVTDRNTIISIRRDVGCDTYPSSLVFLGTKYLLGYGSCTETYLKYWSAN